MVQRHTGALVEIGPGSTDLFKVASSPFLLADGDGHGFGLCPAEAARSTCIEALEAAPDRPLTGDGADIASLVRMKLREADPVRGLELRVDRRLCDRGQTDCLISRW